MILSCGVEWVRGLESHYDTLFWVDGVRGT